jgi:hypothetical protein
MQAYYSALWANFMLCGSAERLQFLPIMLERFERLHPEDASLIDHYVRKLFPAGVPAEHWELDETLRVVSENL